MINQRKSRIKENKEKRKEMTNRRLRGEKKIDEDYKTSIKTKTLLMDSLISLISRRHPSLLKGRKNWKTGQKR